jgi:hypothetical protein
MDGVTLTRPASRVEFVVGHATGDRALCDKPREVGLRSVDVPWCAAAAYTWSKRETGVGSFAATLDASATSNELDEVAGSSSSSIC